MMGDGASAAAAAVQGKVVYEPKSPELTRIERFRQRVAEKHGVTLKDYHAFWQWSCRYPAAFWSECWDEVGIVSSRRAESALQSDRPDIYPPPSWFVGGRLNFAENLLRHSVGDSHLLDQPALIQTAEADPSKPDDFHANTITQRQLRVQVARAVRALRARGVQAGERVASYCSNCAANVVAFLATAAIGAIWVSSAADFAPQGVLERLKTVRPKVLFAVDGVRYNGRVHDHLAKLKEVVGGLEHGRTEEEQRLEGVVVIPYMDQIGAKSDPSTHQHTGWDAFLGEGEGSTADDDAKIEFAQLDFNHPLWILFSSGTTGKPKAIMHRAGGMLIQLAKEHLLHGGATPQDRIFYYTTPGWMMWNWLVGGLITGAPLILFDGSPLRPASTLWSLSAQHGITVFGTSAAYLSALEKSGFQPRKQYPDLAVKQVLSTGSPLRADLYPWIMQAVGPETLIGSITGGTDICSLFAGHNVALPVRAGEIQARNLGMDVDVFDDAGKPVAPGTGSGDLVCKTAFPAQPLCFFSQPEGRHFDTYYAQFNGVWYHGDYVALSAAGGLVMLGRSDGVLNPGGIRFGSSEIYDALEKDRADGVLADVETWLVCALKTAKGDDEVVVLFLVLRDGPESIRGEAWSALEAHIKALIRQKRSARHVPRFIRPIQAVPLTLNGKLAEVPAKKCEYHHAITYGGGGGGGVTLTTLCFSLDPPSGQRSTAQHHQPGHSAKPRRAASLHRCWQRATRGTGKRIKRDLFAVISPTKRNHCLHHNAMPFLCHASPNPLARYSPPPTLEGCLACLIIMIHTAYRCPPPPPPYHPTGAAYSHHGTDREEQQARADHRHGRCLRTLTIEHAAEHLCHVPPSPCQGTSGSGKTTLGTRLAEALAVPFVDGDDLHPPDNIAKMSHGIPLDDGDRLPWLLTIRAKANALCSGREPGLGSREKASVQTSEGKHGQAGSSDNHDSNQESVRALAEQYETSHQHAGGSGEEILQEASRAKASAENFDVLSRQAGGGSAKGQALPVQNSAGRAACVIACSALKQAYRHLLRYGLSAAESSEHGKQTEQTVNTDEPPLDVYHVYLRVSAKELLRRMHERKGHFMKESMLKSQLATLEEPLGEPHTLVLEDGPVEELVQKAKSYFDGEL